MGRPETRPVRGSNGCWASAGEADPISIAEAISDRTTNRVRTRRLIVGITAFLPLIMMTAFDKTAGTAERRRHATPLSSLLAFPCLSGTPPRAAPQSGERLYPTCTHRFKHTHQLIATTQNIRSLPTTTRIEFKFVKDSCHGSSFRHRTL
jgi:hypothetical protein